MVRYAGRRQGPSPPTMVSIDLGPVPARAGTGPPAWGSRLQLPARVIAGPIRRSGGSRGRRSRSGG
jgi:hypothetical protein